MASVSESIRQTDNSRCRICMFPKPNLSSLFRRGLSMKVMKLAEIKMYEGDGLPPTICLDCEVEVNRSVNFIGQIQRSDAKLREMLKNGTEFTYIFENDKELEESEQDASTSQIEIEEFNVKQEMILDNLLDEKVDDNCESDNDHYDVPLEHNDQPEEEAELNPLDHVDVVEDANRSNAMEVPDDPFGQEEPLIESQKNENEPSTDPLICLKQEAVSMDVDKNSPEPCGSTSTICIKQEAVSMDVDKNSPEPCGSTSTEKESLTLAVNFTPEPLGKRSQFQTQVIQENNTLPTQIAQHPVFIPVLEQNVHCQSAEVSVADNISYSDQSEGLGFSSIEISPIQNDVNYNSEQTNEFSLSSRKLSSIPKIKNYYSLQPVKYKSLEFSSNSKPSVSVDVEQTDEMSLAPIRMTKTRSTVEKKAKSSTLTPEDNEGNLKNNFNCFVCNIDFTSVKLLQEHKSENKFICRACTKEFISHAELETHAFNHSIYKCQVCFRQFLCKGDLIKHKQTHNITKYKCEFCNKAFSRFRSLRKHKAEVHEGNGTSHKCIVCGKNFGTDNKLKNHQNRIHVPYEHVHCNICLRVYLGPDDLKQHVRRKHLHSEENTPVSCTKCGKVLTSALVLSRHMETHNTVEVDCEICGKTAKNKSALRHHISLYHTNIKKQSCEICNKQFDDLKMYRKHKRTHKVHNKVQKDVTCEICSKHFKTLRNKKIHMAIHSNDRLLKCEVCGASFKFPSTLINHRKVHNVGKEYSCKYCDRSFRWKQQFSKHSIKCEAASKHV